MLIDAETLRCNKSIIAEVMTLLRQTHLLEPLDKESVLFCHFFAECLLLHMSELSASGALETHLKYIDALACNMAQKLILVIEMSAIHLRGLINCVFYLNGHTATSLRFLDDLNAWSGGAGRTTHIRELTSIGL